MLRNIPVCSFASFSIVSLTSFINKPDFWRDFMYRYLFHLLLYLKLLVLLFVCAADIAAVNPNGNSMFLANGLGTFFFKAKPIFSNGPRSLPRNYLHCTILKGWVFNNFKLADELFTESLWNLKTWKSVNVNLCGKLAFSVESPITFDETVRITSVQF